LSPCNHFRSIGADQAASLPCRCINTRRLFPDQVTQSRIYKVPSRALQAIIPSPTYFRFLSPTPRHPPHDSGSIARLLMPKTCSNRSRISASPLATPARRSILRRSSWFQFNSLDEEALARAEDDLNMVIDTLPGVHHF